MPCGKLSSLTERIITVTYLALCFYLICCAAFAAVLHSILAAAADDDTDDATKELSFAGCTRRDPMPQ